MNRKKLKLALVQADVVQGDKEKNTLRGCELIREAAEKGADIICLPELFNTGYFLSSHDLQKKAEPCDGEFVQTLKRLAKELHVYIIAGYCESCEVPGRIYNSAIFVDYNGETVGNARKLYLWGEEKLKFRQGDSLPVYDTPFGKVGILICYDIEFPEPSRIMALKGAEIIFAPAVWSIPAKRRWDVDLAGNALFNVLYMAGANPVGNAACGKSQVFGPDGELVGAASETEEEVFICEIDMDKIIEERSRLPYLNDFKEETFSMEALKKF